MLQLVVGSEKRRRHAGAHALYVLAAHESRLEAAPSADVGHQLEGVVLVPRRARVEDAPASVADVLKLHVQQLDALALGCGHPVLHVHDVVGEHLVGVLARERAAPAAGERPTRPV